MNWDALQAIAEIVAAIAVLASLVYLSVQIRHNTASVQAATVSRVAELLDDFRRSVWTDPNAAQVHLLALSGEPVADPVLAGRVRVYWFALFKAAENVFYQHEAGQLPDAIWDSYRRELSIFISAPGAAVAMSALGDVVSVPFREFLEAERGTLHEPLMVQFRSRWEDAAQKGSAG